MNLEFSESYLEDLSLVCTYIKESLSTTQHQSINKVGYFVINFACTLIDACIDYKLFNTIYTISSSKRSQINYITTVNHVLFTHQCLTRRRTLSPRSVPHLSLYHSAPPLFVCWWRQSMASFCRRLVAVFLSSAVFWLVRGSALAPGSVSCWRGSWLWWYSRPVIAWSGGYPDYCTHLLFSGNTNTGSNPAL